MSAISNFAGHDVIISPLSVHILFYIAKKKVPDPQIMEPIKQTSLISLDSTITTTALEGPTPDFEDNVQLHSAAAGNCAFFLTSDAKLLKMKFFGKTEICRSLPRLSA